MKSSRSIVLIAIVCVAPLLQGSAGGCCGVDKAVQSIDKINATMEHAISVLDTQSSQWQVTLQNLETQLAQDAQGLSSQLAADVNQLISHVQLVVRDGIQFGQEALNCQTDIFGSRAKVSIQNLLINFLNRHDWKGRSDRPLIPFQPIVCSANPTEIGVVGWQGSTQLVLSGVDFNLLDTARPVAYIVRSSGGDREVPAYHVSRLTNYRLSVNVPNMIAEGLFEATSRQLIIKWEGRRVNNNEIPIVPILVCGGLAQSCCPGGVCRDGNHCSGGVCIAPPCGGLNQGCCPGPTQCTSGRVCNGSICINPPPPPPIVCSETNAVSEEGGSPWTRCAGNAIAHGAHCWGSNCDNMALNCCGPIMPAGASASVSPWFSEEGTANQFSSTGFVSALRCQEDQCDNLSLTFVTHPKLRQESSTCQWSPYFSEESGGKRDCADGYYVSGMRCQQDNCDNVSLRCCRYTLLP